MPERLGIGTFLEQIKARVVSRDDFGTLYHSNIQPDEWLAMQLDPLGVGNPVNLAFVKLLNSTPEPGTTDVFKEYLLRVPPDIRTPQAAEAWSFGLEEEAHAPEWET